MLCCHTEMKSLVVPMKGKMGATSKRLSGNSYFKGHKCSQKFMNAFISCSYTLSFQHLCPCPLDVSVCEEVLLLTSLAALHSGQHAALLLAGGTVKHMCWLCLKTHKERKTAPLQEKTPHEQKRSNNIREPLIQVCGSFTEPHSLIQIWDLQGNLHETHLLQIKKEPKGQNFNWGSSHDNFQAKTKKSWCFSPWSSRYEAKPPFFAAEKMLRARSLKEATATCSRTRLKDFPKLFACSGSLRTMSFTATDTTNTVITLPLFS